MKLIDLSFEMNTLELKLFKEDVKEAWFIFSSQNFSVSLQHETGMTLCEINLNRIFIKDNLVSRKKQNMQYFLVSAEETSAFNAKVKQISVDHPSYKDVDMEVALELGGLKVNLKPNIIKEVLNTFLPPLQQL